MIVKFDIEIFFGNKDFRLWRITIKIILIQQACTCLKEWDKHVNVSKGETNMINKVKSIKILYFSDKKLREVAKEETVVLMWVKLKSLTHRLCLKQQLYSFRMTNCIRNDGGAASEFQ